MTSRQIAALAAGVWCAALAPIHLTMLGGTPATLLARLALVVIAAAAWRASRPTLLIVVLIMLTAAQSGAAWQHANMAVANQTWSGVAQLANDPAPTAGGVRVRAVIDGRVYDLRAWGSAAGRVRPRLMGERLQIEASLRPLDGAPTWLRAQGVDGRGTITRVIGFTEGRTHTRLANSIRRTIEHGARSLSRPERSLFTGLVYGDDRSQSPLTADNFAGAGLTHLLAVSGQNVAFVLAIIGPMLRRLRHRQRFALVVAIIMLFATMTRFEASVVRASVMTAIAATGALVGTAVPARRVLLLAVIGLLVVKPLLVHSVAFQLSLAASAGILLWSGRVARALPGPRPLIDAIAVTATAQLAVAPLLLWRFGGLPVASLPANLLAGPAAGPVMMWGMTGGLLAGLMPDLVATAMHLGTRLGLAWIDGVAQWSAALPLGQLGAMHLVTLAVCGWWGLRQQGEARRRVCLLIIVLVLALPGLTLALRPATSQLTPSGSVLLRDDHMTVLEVGSADRPEQVLADLRGAGIGRLDLLVVRSSSYRMAALIGWIDDRHGVAAIWAPAATMGYGEIVPQPTDMFAIGGSLIGVAFEDDTLRLRQVDSG